MARWIVGILMLGLLGTACSSDQKILGIAVVFPANGREQTKQVRVMAMIPGGQADCLSLLSGAAAPGDPDYPVESQLTVQLPAEQSSGTLKVSQGLRLFFAQAEDDAGEVILQGCTAQEADRDGPDEVVINLDWLTPPCTQDSDCDDGEYCNGDERCLDGECQDGTRDCADGDPCTQDLCDETLDRCSHPAVADPPGTEGPVGDSSCEDGVDNDCDGQTDGDDTQCISCTQDAECDDLNDCTTDSCQQGVCQNQAVADGTACDDGQYCSDPDACSGGRCLGNDRDCSSAADQCNQGACDELAGSCVGVPVTEGTACQDGLFCTAGDACDANGQCQPGILVVCGQDCQTACDEDNDTCLPSAPGTACTSDGLFCNGPEVCDDQGACVGSGDPCQGLECQACNEDTDSCEATPGVACTSDGVYCNGPESCDNLGACVGEGDPCLGLECQLCDEGSGSCQVTAGIPCTDNGAYCDGAEVCDDLGACVSEGDPCASTGCGVCNEGTDSCDVVEGTPCDDGIDCTQNDLCDALGGCAGTPDDAICDAITAGSLCLPECFQNATGCGTPPVPMFLVCDDPVALSVGNTSNCTLALSGPDAATQAGCLSCQARVGVVTVERADFADAGGLCSLDGWTLVGSNGNQCRAKIDNCALGGAPSSCCGDFNLICDDSTFPSGPVLRGNFASNGNKGQWRVYKTLDLSDLQAPWLCYDMAESGAGTSTGLLVYARDSVNAEVQIDCVNGEPQAGADDLFVTRCVALPAWAAGSPDLTLTFIGHSDNLAETMYLDNIVVKGWSGGCSGSPAAAFSDDFAGCDLSNWSTAAGSVSCLSNGCSNQGGWLPGIFGDGPSAAVQTVVNTGSLAGEVQVCFRVGSDTPLAADALRLLVDAGSGPVLEWENSGPLGPDGQCFEFCRTLSDPAAAHNPGLVLRFEFDGTGTIGLYGVTVSGEPYCDPTGQLDLTALTDAGGGSYQFTATDSQSVQLGASLQCTWGPDPTAAASQSLWFQP